MIEHQVQHGMNTYRCDICGNTVEETEAERQGLIVFCPGCTRDMREDIAMQQSNDEDSLCR